MLQFVRHISAGIQTQRFYAVLCWASLPYSSWRRHHIPAVSLLVFSFHLIGLVFVVISACESVDERDRRHLSSYRRRGIGIVGGGNDGFGARRQAARPRRSVSRDEGISRRLRHH